VGEGALVKANIAVKNIYIAGDVQGSIEVKEKISISSTGKFFGDVRASVFVMEEGALFDGQSHMVQGAEKKTKTPSVE
jgi:cytoskeletal protein CcmA (bactofilin family)